MKRHIKIFTYILCFAIVVGLAIYARHLEEKKVKEFELIEDKIETTKATTNDRVINGTITIPNSTQKVTLKNGTGSYTLASGINGKVVIESKLIKTELVGGEYGKNDPRLDAIAPIKVTADSKGGSEYVALFRDDGQKAELVSYLRLGGPNTKVQKIDIMPSPEEGKTDYLIDVIYMLEGLSRRGLEENTMKEAIIPVVNGQFALDSVVMSDLEDNF